MNRQRFPAYAGVGVMLTIREAVITFPFPKEQRMICEF